MIDITNAKWDLSKEEKYVIEWFDNNGFDGKLIKQYVSKTKFEVEKYGVKDYFDLTQGITGMDVESYMQQYEKSFKTLCELQKLREEVNKRNH